MTTQQLADLIRPYRTFSAHDDAELRAAIRRQARPSALGRRVEQALAARHASERHALPQQLPAAA